MEPGTRNLPALATKREQTKAFLFNWKYIMSRNMSFSLDELSNSIASGQCAESEMTEKPLVIKKRFLNKETHRYNQVMRCATCSMEFKNVNTLKDHLVKHSG